ncbi:glycosyltransferase [Aliikangiella sp. IMCC44359]|uniref:glycosyltransferase n=1 Tax=Aliikangiella sp. IMCC44359 TaxID=3459125 RepID=UPI00403AA741
MKNFGKKHIIQIAFIGLFYCISLAVVYLSMVTQPSSIDSLATIRLAVFCILFPILIKYFLQLVVAPFYSVVEKIRGIEHPSPKTEPLVSVLIPAWNEEVGIIKTLSSVLDTYYEKLEVIVINDGSTDSTHELIKEYLTKHEKIQFLKPKIKYLNLRNGGKARALNKGLKIAKGEIVVTVDADSVMDRYTVSNIVKRFNDPKVGAVAGNVIVGNKSKPLEVIQQLEYLYGFFFKRADSVFNSVYIIGGAAAAYRKSVLDEVGGFDHEIITEDIEMSTRILSKGYKTRYAADAIVYTEGPSDWSGLCNQRLRWKFGRLLTFIKHKNLFFSKDKKHTPYLSFLLFPLAVYSEVTLLLEGPLLALFYGYTIFASDYFPLAFVILFMTSLISLQIIFDPKSRFHYNLLFFAPIAWVVFYIIDVVEFQALFRSLCRLIKRETIQWQKWVRAGVMN